MSAQKVMFCLTACPGGKVQAPQKPLHCTQQDITHLKYLFLIVSLELIPSGDLGDNAAPALEEL